jgi:hypothetical protein
MVLSGKIKLDCRRRKIRLARRTGPMRRINFGKTDVTGLETGNSASGTSKAVSIRITGNLATAAASDRGRRWLRSGSIRFQPLI